MKKNKTAALAARISAVTLSAALLCSSLFSCSSSAYDTPEKYVSLSELSQITVDTADIEQTFDDLIEQLLINLSDKVYTPVEEPDATIMEGDKICIYYSGIPTDNSVELSDEILKSLTNTSDEKGYEFVVGDGDFIPEIEDAAIGKNINSPFEVNVEYTEETAAYEELEGLEIKFDVTVVSVSRQVIDEKHSVTLRYSAELANGDEPLDTILTLLEKTSENLLLSDDDAAFDIEFRVADVKEFIIGRSPSESFEFTLILPAENAAVYGYDEDVELLFSAEITSAYKAPEKLTDELVDSLTDGEYQSSEQYEQLLRDMIREDLAFQAIADAAVYTDELPEEEYNTYYSDNYNSALYAALGDISSLTSEELAQLMTEELTEQVENTARENAIAELHERLLLEYLFKLLSITISDEEYEQMLSELYESYETNYYFMLYTYGITSPEELADYLGREYLETQFKYQKLLPVIAEKVVYV